MDRHDSFIDYLKTNKIIIYFFSLVLSISIIASVYRGTSDDAYDIYAEYIIHIIKNGTTDGFTPNFRFSRFAPENPDLDSFNKIAAHNKHPNRILYPLILAIFVFPFSYLPPIVDYTVIISFILSTFFGFLSLLMMFRLIKIYFPELEEQNVNRLLLMLISCSTFTMALTRTTPETLSIFLSLWSLERLSRARISQKESLFISSYFIAFLATLSREAFILQVLIVFYIHYKYGRRRNALIISFTLLSVGLILISIIGWKTFLGNIFHISIMRQFEDGEYYALAKYYLWTKHFGASTIFYTRLVESIVYSFLFPVTYLILALIYSDNKKQKIETFIRLQHNHLFFWLIIYTSFFLFLYSARFMGRYWLPILPIIIFYLPYTFKILEDKLSKKIENRMFYLFVCLNVLVSLVRTIDLLTGHNIRSFIYE
jgi:hypothetical protein